MDKLSKSALTEEATIKYGPDNKQKYLKRHLTKYKAKRQMQPVVDANILIAAFLKSAATRRLLTDDKIHLFAPEYFSSKLNGKS